MGGMCRILAIVLQFILGLDLIVKRFFRPMVYAMLYVNGLAIISTAYFFAVFFHSINKAMCTYHYFRISRFSSIQYLDMSGRFCNSQQHCSLIFWHLNPLCYLPHGTSGFPLSPFFEESSSWHTRLFFPWWQITK